MQTAARATISSASTRSSSSNGSARWCRTNMASPSVMPRARTGTIIIEWNRKARALAWRARSGLAHRATPSSVSE